jgi:hypothetical protein
MRTMSYNPSILEIQFAEALLSLKTDLEQKMPGVTIERIENKLDQDNPLVFLHLLDVDGDPHEMVIKVIQRPDKF